VGNWNNAYILELWGEGQRPENRGSNIREGVVKTERSLSCQRRESSRPFEDRALRREQYTIELRQRTWRQRVLIIQEKLGTLKYPQYEADFGGQICFVGNLGEVMTRGKFKRLDLFQSLTIEMDRWVCLTILPE